jgi:hypothetical protein
VLLYVRLLEKKATQPTSARGLLTLIGHRKIFFTDGATVSRSLSLRGCCDSGPCVLSNAQCIPNGEMIMNVECS